MMRRDNQPLHCFGKTPELLYKKLDRCMCRNEGIAQLQFNAFYPTILPYCYVRNPRDGIKHYSASLIADAHRDDFNGILEDNIYMAWFPQTIFL